MATCRTIFSRASTFLNCRSLLQPKNQLPCYQQCALLKTKDIEKLGISVPPKKPLVSFFRFKNEQLPKLKAENPQLTQKEILMLLGREWENYPPEKKEILQREWAAAQEEYKTMIADYKKNLSPDELKVIKEANQKKKQKKKNIRLRRKRENLDKPKKPLSAYILFCAEKMNETTKTGSHKDFIKIVGNSWKTLPLEEKEQYQKKSQKLREQYEKDMAAWEAKMIEEGHLEVLGQRTLRKLHKEYKTEAKKSEDEN